MAREAIERFIEAAGPNRLTRVFLAVEYFTALYSKSKCGDRVYVAQIAAVARIPGDVDERHTRRALKKLHELGVIVWKPARGRGNPSWVSLAADKTRPLLAPVSGGKTGPPGSRKPGQLEIENPASGGPPTEKDREEVREEVRGLIIDKPDDPWLANLAVRKLGVELRSIDVADGGA